MGRTGRFVYFREGESHTRQIQAPKEEGQSSHFFKITCEKICSQLGNLPVDIFATILNSSVSKMVKVSRLYQCHHVCLCKFLSC